MVPVSPMMRRPMPGTKKQVLNPNPQRQTAPLRPERAAGRLPGKAKPAPADHSDLAPRAAHALGDGPFLKWAGGKRQLLPNLMRRVPDLARGGGRYFEPFVGGGALFFALAQTGRLPKGAARLSDINGELITTYRVVRDDVEGLIQKLRAHENTEEHYYGVRAQDPRHLSATERAARLIYLNKTCFNGLFRENSRGEFNVPFGRYARPCICAEDTLRAASAALRDVAIEVASFEETAQLARPGDFVYCDPPYAPVSRTASFTRYSAGGFDEVAQARLALVAALLAERGVNVMLSNSVAPLVRELYASFHIVEEVQATRAINSRADRRGKVGELILCAGPAYHPSRRV